MADDKEALLVSVEKKNETQAPPFSSVRLVSRWALLNAVVIFGIFALVCALDQLHITLPSWWREGPELTGAAADEAEALVYGLACCIVAQAAAAAVALLLRPDHCCRRTLAYVALAATTAGHIMIARVATLLLTAGPGYISLWIASTVDIVTFAAGDIVCFIDLLLHGSAAQETGGILKY